MSEFDIVVLHMSHDVSLSVSGGVRPDRFD